MIGEKTNATVCEVCGSRIESTASGELGCMVCLLREGMGEAPEEAESSSGTLLLSLCQYVILRREDGTPWELGRGAMGVTYRAQDTSLDREVALKIIKTDLVGPLSEARERFMREARAAAALRHPNVATVYQFGIDEENGQCFCAMELIEGETLDERVQRTGPLDAPSVIEIAQQITAALMAAERHGLIHRDLKPANVMIIGGGERGAIEAKIIDFGLAKALNAPVDPMSLTRGDFVGTPAFASPEQFEHSALDVRSDIYSLGETLWFALTGKTPFAGHSVEEIHRAQQLDAPPIAQLKAAHVPHRLRSLLESMVAFEPAARPGTHDLAARLQRCSAQASGVRRTRVALTAVVILILLVALVTAFMLVSKQLTRSTLIVPEKSIAVLPFQNLSDKKENAYFAEGIQNEILTKLATVRDLKVISRTSTAKYQSKPDNLKRVAQELGVSTVLEGALQKIGDKVRLSVQLIDARADTHLWSKSYDRDLKDVLGVESEVSQEIAEALQVNLSPSESDTLASAWTQDTEAYDLFLRGEYDFHRAESSLSVDAYDRANAFYRQALAQDPNFAEAAAELARSRLEQHWDVSPLAPAELEEAKSIIDHALALAPNLPEAHLTLGLFFYWGHHQFETALVEFNRTLKLQPNNAMAREYRAGIYRRRGEWEHSLADFRRAEELDPRDALIPQGLGLTYLFLRQWKEAERAESRALIIDPHNAGAAITLFASRLNATGNVDSAWRALDGFPEARKLLIPAAFVGVGAVGDVQAISGIWVYLEVIERRFTDAFQDLEKEVANDDAARLRLLAGRAALRVLAGQTEAAKSAGEEALPLLEARFRERPDDTFAMTELSWVYLALGRNADALRIFRQAVDSMPLEQDAFSGPIYQTGLAQIEARAGAPEEAIKRLRLLLSIPAGKDISIARLKTDPVWDPIRNRPNFQQLLSGPEQIGPNK